MRHKDAPIPVPLSNRIRLLLTQQLQGWLFALSVVAVGVLWLGQRPRVILTGQVEMVRVVVPASRDGVLQFTGQTLARFDRVEEGVTPVASIDVTDALLEMQALTTQREQLQAELESQRQKIQRDQLQWRWQIDQERRELQRQTIDRDRTRLAARERVDRLTSDVIDLDQQRRSLEIKLRENQAASTKADTSIQSLSADLEHVDRQIQRRISPPSQRIQIEQELQLQRQSLQAASALAQLMTSQRGEIAQQLAATKTRLADASKQLAVGNVAVGTMPDTNPMTTVARQAGSLDPDTMLEPHIQSIAVHDAKIRTLANQIATNQIVAPATGTIAEIHQPTGTYVRSGDPILTIASDQHRWIVAYVSGRDRAQVQAEATVQIRVAGAETLVATSSVAQFGNQYESVPSHLRRDENVAQWGVPIKVPIPAGVSVSPGQRVELLIQ